MKNKFAATFKNLRLQQGLKQSELAKSLSTTQRKISYWESGKIEPDLDSLMMISKFFEISIDELLGNNTIDK